MRNNIKLKLSSDKGITLIALTITIAIMLIIVGISINNGTESIDSTRLQAFYMQLEIIQKRADDIVATNEGYYNNAGTYIDLKTAGGKSVTSEQSAFLQGLGVTIPANEFRYFTVSDLEEQLDLIEMDQNVFIHFNTRTVIAEDGININGEMYHVLKNDIYYANQNTSKNEGVLSLKYDSITKYGTDRYKIIVTPSTVGDLTTNGILRYKRTNSKYWKTANGLEVVISELGQYNIEYTDSNKNIVTEIIEVYLVKGIPTIMIYNYS